MTTTDAAVIVLTGCTFIVGFMFGILARRG